MRINNAWLQHRIAIDPDIDVEAGLPFHLGPHAKYIEAIIATSGEIQKKHGLGLLLCQLRRRDKMDIEQVAKKLGVDAAELNKIEGDPNFIPNPRTMHKISVYYELPASKIIKLTAAARESDPELDSEIVTRFAACSSDISSLTKEERQKLNEVIKLLRSK